MRISVGHIHARCQNCSGEEFLPVPGQASALCELVCAGCGLSTTQRVLLMQVADETVRQADAYLEASRKLRNPPTR